MENQYYQEQPDVALHHWQQTTHVAQTWILHFFGGGGKNEKHPIVSVSVNFHE